MKCVSCSCIKIILIPIVILTLNACGNMLPSSVPSQQPPQPVVVVIPSPPATATPIPIRLEETLEFAERGITLQYPKGWYTRHMSNTLALSSNEAAISASSPGSDLVIIIDSTPIMTTTTYEVDKLMTELANIFRISSAGPAQAGYTIGATQPISVDGNMGLYADLTANGGAGQLVVLMSPPNIVRVLGQANPETWTKQYELFQEIVGSMRFSKISVVAIPTSIPVDHSLQPSITKTGPPGFLLRIGSNEGPREGRFVSARGLVAASDGTVYLAESSRGIWVFSPDGTLIQTFGKDILRSGAYDVGLGPDGDVFVADYGNNAILRFRPNGTLVRQWGESGEGKDQFGSQSPQRIAVGVDSSVYALDTHVNPDTGNTMNSIARFDGENGKFLERISLPLGLTPNDLAVDSMGNIYLADATNGAVLKLDYTGKEVARFGKNINTRGISAAAIDLDKQGNVYVATWSEGILEFAPDGTLIAQGGANAATGTLPMPGQFSLPNGIAVAPGDAVWVSDNNGEYSAITALRLLGVSNTQTTTSSITMTRPISESGVLRQWVYSATASSQYGDDYSANNVVGPPDATVCRDSTKAWASATPNSIETLNLTFETPVFAKEVNIYQNHQPGFITQVDLLDERGKYTTVYTGVAKLQNECPYVMKVRFEPVIFRVVGIKLTVDQRGDANWNEIDAVELIGAP